MGIFMSTTKILILGLENSGKTSIVLNNFKKDFNLMSYYGLKPTTGVDITNLEEEIQDVSIWDLGGQEEYRERHLDKLPTYLAGADQLIYVIDIQNNEQYDIALNYFKEIIEIISKEGAKLEISIYFHKFDPNIEKKKPELINKEALSELTQKFIKLIPPDYHYWNHLNN